MFTFKVKNRNLHPSRRRYSEQTKEFAQSLDFKSPAVLRMLKKKYKLILPSNNTIRKLTRKREFEGFNEDALNDIKDMAKNLEGKFIMLTP